MKISHVKIHNVLGIEDLEFTPGQSFNEITGGNDRNKTNLINAIKSVVEGGHDATLLRAGAPKGEVVLVLDDGVTLTKTVTPKRSTTEVTKSGVAEPLKRPMEIIATLADLFSVNPIAFLTAPKADRARVMLESMPIVLDKQKLAKLAGTDLPNFHQGIHATTIIDTVRRQIYDARTGVNRILEEKKGTIEQLRKAMPEAPGDIQSNEAELEAQLADIDAQLNADMDTVSGKLDAWLTNKDQKVAGLVAEHNAAIDALRSQISALTTAHQEALGNIQTQTAAVKERAATRRNEITSGHTAARQPIVAALSTLKANRSAVTKREQTIETIKAMTQAADLLKAESDEQTAALGAIDAYKLELLATLPIPGIEVVNGEVFRNGIPFDRLNHAQRTDIAIELAKLRAGKLGFVSVDGLELLDPDAYDEFQKKAIDSGLQFFVTRVGRGDLQINTQ